MDDGEEPQIQIAVSTLTNGDEEDVDEPSGMPCVPERSTTAHTDEWRMTEHEYRDDSHPTVFVPDTDERIRNRREALEHESEEAIGYIKQMHDVCFGQDDLIQKALQVTGLDMGTVMQRDQQSISDLFKGKVYLLVEAIDTIRRKEDMEDQHRIQICTAARESITVINKLNQVLGAYVAAQSCIQGAVTGNTLTSDLEASWQYMPDVPNKKPNALQQLYRIAFEEARVLEYARYRDCFMKRIMTAEGRITNAWEKVCTFQKFVYDLTWKPDGKIQYLSSQSANVMDQVAELLGKKREPVVPWLEPDRHVFAFKNGCYLANHELFIRFTPNSVPMMPNGDPCPTACKYHDVSIDEEWLDTPDYYSIPTPLMDHIMDTQRLSHDVKRCYFSMLGRSIYDLNEMDNWQVFLFIKGQAETGKSTLLKFVGSFYNSEDIGILSNNIEEKFGASMIADKFVVVGDDLGENFTLDQQLFQNICSGNEVSLPQKNKRALVIKWITQLLLSGNVLPDYKDNSGSFSRRLLIIHYAVPVQRVDPTIPRRLEREVGAAIIKCNRAYRHMVRRLEHLLNRPENPLPFWDAIPEEFKTQKRNVMQCANAFMSFLNSGHLVFGHDLYMPWDMWLNQLMTYCHSNGIQKPKAIPSQYEGAFAIMNLERQNRKKYFYPRKNGREMLGNWIVGCDLTSAEALVSSANLLARAATGRPANNKRPADSSINPPNKVIKL
jgi:hypothetical protein